MNELQLQYKLCSPYVVRCLGVMDTNALTGKSSVSTVLNDSGVGQSDESNFSLVMDYMDGGSLNKLLTHPDYRTVSSEARVWLVQQVANAVHALSKENIVHGDIKSFNFLWDVVDNNTHPVVKITDFGNAKLHATMQNMSLSSFPRTAH